MDTLAENYRRAFTEYKETDKEFIIEVELPGVEKDDIKLNVTDTGIEIKAEKKQEKEEADDKSGEYRYAGRYAGFYQAFDVPDNADLENIDAEYKNGVLKIKIPKRESAKSRKEVEIK